MFMPKVSARPKKANWGRSTRVTHQYPPIPMSAAVEDSTRDSRIYIKYFSILIVQTLGHLFCPSGTERRPETGSEHDLAKIVSQHPDLLMVLEHA